MAYASPSDLVTVGLPAQALGALTDAQVRGALNGASTKADSYLRARYGTAACPLLQWDASITEAVAKMAAFNLMVMRGMNAMGPDWQMFNSMKKDAEDYFGQIQRQQAHPLVTLAGTGVAPQQPNLTSSSVVDLSNGARGSNRGW